MKKIIKLNDANLLGVILFQFQLDFEPNFENKRWVEFCRSQVPERIKMVVEFRSRTWYNENNISSTLKWLEEINCIKVISDELLRKYDKEFRLPPRCSLLTCQSVDNILF